MSLVADRTLLALWSAAQTAVNLEWPSRTFWNQLLSKYFFTGKKYVVTSEEPPSSTSERRRIDIVVKYVEMNESIRVLCFVESTRSSASFGLVDEFEHQVFNACVSYLSQRNLRFVYAMTAIGTRARLWIYRPPNDHLDPLFGNTDLPAIEEYVEANSIEAENLTIGFNKMKSGRPHP